MSEYQYYEFRAIDRPLDDADRQALRALSSRARITATSFVNTYEWGDFKGDPAKLMDRWFDLHVYIANWGTRRLMIRLPARLVDLQTLDRFLGDVDGTTVRRSGDNLILDIWREDVDPDEDWDDGSGWAADLAQLRTDVLAGDLRLFYLLWMTAVEADLLAPDEPEPMPGMAPLTGALETFAEFLQIDPDLVAAAAERRNVAIADGSPSPDELRQIVARMTEAEKTEMLARMFEGDPHVAVELRRTVQDRRARETGIASAAPRAVAELQSRATAIRLAFERAQAEKRAAEERRQAREAEKARRARLDAIARRGEEVWSEIETEIGRRNPAGYDKAANLLGDLQAIAEASGTPEDFRRRLRAIRERHAQKQRLIERLTEIG